MSTEIFRHRCLTCLVGQDGQFVGDALHQHFRSLVDDDDDRALQDLSADSTMTSPLLCDTAYLSVSRMESLSDLFPSSSHRP